MARRPSPLSMLALVVPALAIGLAGCAQVTVPAGPDAGDPRCASIIVNAPDTMLGEPKRTTSSQSTVAWGDGDRTIVLRCGVAAPGPTTDQCTTLEDADKNRVDWIVREKITGSGTKDGYVTYTTFGRTPAIDITVPLAAAPDQPSAVPLEMARQVTGIPAHDHCVGPGDA